MEGLFGFGISFILACLKEFGKRPIERDALSKAVNFIIAESGRFCNIVLFMFVCPGVLFFNCFITLITSCVVILAVRLFASSRLSGLACVYGVRFSSLSATKLFTNVSVLWSNI